MLAVVSCPSARSSCSRAVFCRMLVRRMINKSPRPVAPWGVCALAMVVGFATAGAAELDEVRRRGELVWAADQEGGGPHVFPAPDDPTRLTGFEVEFAELLAAELGVKARFQQGQWDRLPLLRRGVRFRPHARVRCL